MRRKVIKQGSGGCTISLPIDWVRKHGISPGEDVELKEDDNALILTRAEEGGQLKKKEIALAKQDLFFYRSLIGGLYRSGYDEIDIDLLDPHVLPGLQKTINTFYGFEIFDADKNSCKVKNIYPAEAKEVRPHLIRMIHMITTMQSMLLEDLKKGSYNSLEDMKQFRINVLKQRDLVARIITKNKLLNDDFFPFYRIVFSLGDIARGYELLYQNIPDRKGLSKKSIDFIRKVTVFFADSLARLEKTRFKERHETYERLLEEAITLLRSPAADPVVMTFSMEILLSVQSVNSSIFILPEKGWTKEKMR